MRSRSAGFFISTAFFFWCIVEHVSNSISPSMMKETTTTKKGTELGRAVIKNSADNGRSSHSPSLFDDYGLDRR